MAVVRSHLRAITTMISKMKLAAISTFSILFPSIIWRVRQAFTSLSNLKDRPPLHPIVYTGKCPIDLDNLFSRTNKVISAVWATIGSKCYVSSKYGKLYWTVGSFDLVLELSITVSFLIKVALHLSKSSVMESNQKVELELINMAIQRLVEEKKIKEAFSTDCLDDQLLLSKLLSQLESLKGDGTIKEPEASTEASTEIDEVSPTTVCNVDNKMENAGQLNGGSKETESEIVKELKKVKRQNFVTHCLLSVLIVLTAAWQVSEVKLILKVREGFSHPFQSFGSLLTGMLKDPNKNGEDAQKQPSHAKQPIEAPPLLDLKIPELPRVDLPDLGLNGENK